MPPTSTDLYTIVGNSGLHPRVVYNWYQQYRLAQCTLLPWLAKHVQVPRGGAVAEIGCAEGGVLMAAAQAYGGYALGTDIQGPLLQQYSAVIAKMVGLEVSFTEHDVILGPIDPAWEGRFDVVFLRDVLEHLDDTWIALRNIMRLLKPGGALVVTFPPYTSAFGGHQQLLQTKMGSLPFVHLLPRALFERVIRQTTTVNEDEVRRLASIRLSGDRVRTAAADVGYNILDERYFMLRPVFRYKYASWIPTIDVTTLRAIPIVRRLAMEAAFILQRPA